MSSIRLYNPFTSRTNGFVIFSRLYSSKQVSFSSSSDKRSFKIQINGGREYNDVKQYVLFSLPQPGSQKSKKTWEKMEGFSSPTRMASLYLKRNIIFGTQIHQTSLSYIETCHPLLDFASSHAGEYGDQPQMLARLRGLSSYIRHHSELLSNPPSNQCSRALLKLNKERFNNKEGQIAWNAIKSISTQIAQPNQSKIELGTYRDARSGWEDLAKEYALLRKDSPFGDEEAKLYVEVGGVLAQIETVYEDSQRDYLLDSGGVMARFFIV